MPPVPICAWLAALGRMANDEPLRNAKGHHPVIEPVVKEEKPKARKARTTVLSQKITAGIIVNRERAQRYGEVSALRPSDQ